MAMLNTQDYMNQIVVNQLRRTIRYAGLRCLSPEEIISKILDTTDEDDRSAYISRLLELRLNKPELNLLQRAMTTLIRRSENAPSALKRKLDRAVLRLVRMLPSRLATTFAGPYIGHRQKTRREWAYSALRAKRIPRRMARELVSVFRRTGDQEALELIARNPKRVPEIDPEFLLMNIKERYWRGRAIEALLVHKPSAAFTLAGRYPFEFAHAVGRIGDKTFRVPLCDLLHANFGDLEFLSIYAYALSKIGAKEELESLKTLVPEARDFRDDC
jgi:hypothetical protein